MTYSQPWQNDQLIMTASVTILFMGISGEAIAQAQVPVETTSTNNTNTTINVVGNDFRIGGGAGTSNLFHEFENFRLAADQSATFLAPNNVDNILGYVLGNNNSTINGTLQTFGGDANLFLINPNGIIFGDTASLNINGSFVATTATRIAFSDGKNINLEQLKMDKV